MFVWSFSRLGLTVSEETLTKYFNVWRLERRKNYKKIKGRISSSSLIPVYTIHPPIVHVCNMNEPSRPHSFWDRCDETFQRLKIGEKEKWRIKRQICSSRLILVYTIHLPTVHVCTKFQPSRPHSSWEKCNKKFLCLKIEEKENWINKGTNKQQQPDSSIHDASTHYPRLCQVSTF